MKEKDAEETKINLTEVLQKVVSEYEAGNLESIQLSVNCGIRNPKYDDLKQNSVPMDVVMGLVSGLKTLEEYVHGFNSEEAHHELCCQVPTVAREALEKFEQWQKGRES